MRIPIVAILLVALSPTLLSAEVTWDPSQPYNSVREGESSWTHSEDASRCEYGLKYLLEAHKDAVESELSSGGKVLEGSMTHEEIVRLRTIVGNLSEVVKSEYTESARYFQKEPNPDLLLMLLYHFKVYCYGGDSCESWPEIIQPLQELDPEMTAKADKWAVKGIEALHKISE